MKKYLVHFRDTYFASQLELRVRLFHVLAIGGMFIGLFMGIFGFIVNMGMLNIVFCLTSSVLSYVLLTYSRVTSRYYVCYFITVIVIFMGMFPVMFFTGGGYHSGMPSFFVFAVAFTIFMLEGKKAVIFSLAELALYIAICLIAYYYPQTVISFEKEQDVVIDIIVAFTVVSTVLGVSLFLHFRLYSDQQRKLDEQNIILAQVSRAKTEFLANTSHEMRTPLTIISVNVQTVGEILEDMGETVKDPEAGKLLETAQSEIMRLSRMVGGMLTLASMSENADKGIVDFSVLLKSNAEMLRLHLQNRGNTLVTHIAPGLVIFGNADLLAQVITNLLQNAGKHTENGSITVTAETADSLIIVTVCDTGTGVQEDILPYVFERSVTVGGTGFGLFLCRTVVESHGGKIWIKSEHGRGTAVYFTLPVYQGQFGGTKNE